MSFFVVLVVEDYPDMVELYESTLDDPSVRWLKAPTIKEAKEMIEVEHFDLVVLDGNVPEMPEGTPVSTNGLLELLRRSFNGPVICCASDPKQRKLQFASAGRNSHCCDKPDVPDKVRSVRELLGQ